MGSGRGTEVMLEHGSGMDCARKILSACDETPRKQDKRLVTSSFFKHGIVLEMYFHAPPRCSG